MNEARHPAFSGYGVEIEYMIVDALTLDVKPIADVLLDKVGGAEDMDVSRGDASWSNELALHVIEIKTSGPASDLSRARDVLSKQVQDLVELLAPLSATLLPTGMHPWMDPLRETRLWPHQNNTIYQTFDRIFDCRGHGWSNLQSTHINFPFQNDEEFERVHAACRFVLPLLPAVAASSPFLEGKKAPALDARLAAYRNNCAKVPSVTGRVVPERVYSQAAYEELLQGIYRDLAPYDQDAILAEEWVNARGCIARFDRGAVEIRLLDAQECPRQDLAIVYFVTELVRSLAQEEFMPLKDLCAWDEWALSEVLFQAIERGEEASATLSGYAHALGSSAENLGELFSDLLSRIPSDSEHLPSLRRIAEEGPLARRILRAADRGEDLKSIYQRLADSLQKGTFFSA